MSGKPAVPVALTPRDLQYVSIAWQSLESEPKLNYERFAQLAGLKNKGTASAVWNTTKKKLAAAAATGGAPTTPGKAKGTKTTPASSAKKTASIGSKRKMAAVVHENNDDDDDEEEDYDHGTPSKKPAYAMKMEAMKEEEMTFKEEDKAED